MQIREMIKRLQELEDLEKQREQLLDSLKEVRYHLIEAEETINEVIRRLQNEDDQ